MSSSSAAFALRSPEVKPELVPKTAYCIDPLHDARWDSFLQSHPLASLFHTSAWLKALHKTYGYKAIAYTTSAPGNTLENAMVFCRVESWLTGRRLVSLSFSDHCELLVDSEEDTKILAAALDKEIQRERWDYVELRPLQRIDFLAPLVRTTVSYSYHKLDLRPGLDVLFSNLQHSSIQRKIRRGEREGLTYAEGSTKELLDHFYRLFILTRKRLHVPPQPKAWFANLMDCFGEALKIRVAFKNDEPVAAIITIAYKDTLAYKYGACNSQFNNLGGMHLLLWRAIRDAKAAGLCCMDFGRSDGDQQSLITFKNRWGASQSVLTYSRYGRSQSSTHWFDLATTTWKTRTAKFVLSHLPTGAFSRIGQMLYGHVG